MSRMDPDRMPQFLDTLTETQGELLASITADWDFWARSDQRWPEGDWSNWVILAGRGWGKTRTGKEHTHRLGMQGGHKMALIARTHSDLRDVMIDGRSGLLSRQLTVPAEIPLYKPSQRKLIWPRPAIRHVTPKGSVGAGAVPSEATTFTSKEPDDLRGPEFSWAWCDELAAWHHLPNCWSNLKLALRHAPGGFVPRLVVTTTPRPLQFLRELIARPETTVTGGSTYDNLANLPKAFIQEITALYGDTSLGRQEIYAQILDEAEGALWKRAWIDANRVPQAPELKRIVIPVDPAVSSKEASSETGIIPVGMAPLWDDKLERFVDHYYVLDDLSLIGKPHEWAGKVVDAFEQWMADLVVGEVNNGGEMVESTIQALDRKVRGMPIPFKAVHASRAKDARAEPVAILYQLGRVHHVGLFTGLEDQLCNWVPNTNVPSPDRLDSMVWGIWELCYSGSKLPTSLAGLEGLEQQSAWSVG